MAALGRFGPPLALMAVIFALSSRQDLDPGEGAFGDLVPVAAHFVEYALLFLLWHRALGRRGGRSAPVAAAVALLYAVSDEVHQSFVPGRDAAVTDVLIDAAGIATAWLTIRSTRAR